MIPNSELDQPHKNFVQALQATFAPEQVYTDYLSRYAYGTDASFYRYVPQVVVRAHCEAEIICLLALAKAYRVALTFRASGTSLSGQTCSDSVLVLVGDAFLGYEILAGGEKIRLGAMVVGGYANRLLKPYQRKIGPDPASINSARIGGIVANNSSGMCCGTKENSYHTLDSLRMILADGAVVDTGDPQSLANFTVSHQPLLAVLTGLANKIRLNPELKARVQHKYRMKNTTGYGLNALVDFDDPIEILAHLMIGSEGTLGFISEVVYRTVYDYADKASAFVYFTSLDQCCRAVTDLRLKATVDAVELFDSGTILAIGQEKVGLPEFFYADLTSDCACLLIETKASDDDQLDRQIEAINELLAAHNYSEHTGFQKDPAISDHYWAVRKGLLPIVAGNRALGANLITEDVVFPIERLADGVRRLNELFLKHGYSEGMVMGHALEGNMHFILAPMLNNAAEIARFNTFLQEITDMVALEFDGSLKGEHGTGRNIAPFVRKEWGEELYAIMCALKALLDPETILNPEVIISSNSNLHITALKAMPATDVLINACMECGFCEPACPSDGLSLTPRQRISVYRNLQAWKHEDVTNGAFIEALDASYQYKGIDTCAMTSMCALRCPIGIDTGRFIQQLKPQGDTKITALAQKNIALVSAVARTGLKLAYGIGMGNSQKISEKLHQRIASIPVVTQTLPKAIITPVQNLKIADANSWPKVVYFVSCVNRVMSENNHAFSSTAEHTVNLFTKAKWTAIFPEKMTQLCCGQPFASVNAPDATKKALLSLNDQLLAASNAGAYPIYIDNAPCALRMLEAQQAGLMDQRLQLYDGPRFLYNEVLPKLTLSKKIETLSLHIPCSTTKIGSSEALAALAQKCSSRLLPTEIPCCGFAGNKGLFTPELNKNSLRNLRQQLETHCTHGVSASKTCQIGLTTHSGLAFQSIEALLDECSH